MGTKLNLLLVIMLLSAVITAQEVIPTDITFQRESVTLHGKFYPANEVTNSPTLLILQGFPGGEYDVLGLGKRLSVSGINVMTFNYSGTHKSEGLLSFKNCQADIAAAMDFLRSPQHIERFKIDTSNIFLGGYSYGGGMAMTYAVQHPETDKVISVAGNDWGEHFEDYVKIPALKTAIDGMVRNTESTGIVRFEKGERPAELLADGTGKLQPALYIKRNAAKLSAKNILLIAGWDDEGVVLERYTLPIYRALQSENAKEVKIVAFQDDHSFRKSRTELASTIARWITQIAKPYITR